MLDVCINQKSHRAGGVPHVIIRDIRFTLTKGEIVGLLGPSGSGKSSLLRIVVGLDKSYDGSVRHMSSRIGVAFQEPRLLPWLTVAGNIHAVLPAQARVDIDALLDLVQLGSIGTLYPRQLSLGMARRVSLARALAITPDLLVLDEPFASLDAQLGSNLFDRVIRFARDNSTTVLVATHDLAQALGRTSRLLVLSGHPTTLEADVAVPAHDSGEFQKKLMTEFSFLASDSAVAKVVQDSAGMSASGMA